MCAAWFGGCKRRIAHSHNTKCSHIKADKILRPIFYLFCTDALACGDAAGKWLFGNRKYTVLNNARDINAFSYQQKIREKVRKMYGIKEEIVIGHVGGFYEQKNHRFLVQIYREIIKQEPKAKCFMIGDGPLKSDIENLISDIKQNIIMLGTTNRISDYLQAMDGMLLPSVFEGVPLVAVEWQINGLPCLLSDTITKECVFTESAKFMSLEQSAAKWAEEIIWLVKHNDRSGTAHNNLRLAQDSPFNLEHSVQILRDFYSEKI